MNIHTGDVFSDIGDDFKSAADWVNDNVLGPVEDVVSSITDACGRAAQKACKDGDAGCSITAALGGVCSFAIPILSTAFGTAWFAALAPLVGPQLASVAFSFPGVLEGKDFSKAYLSALTQRIQDTAKLDGPEVATKITADLQPAWDGLKAKFPDIESAAPSFPDANEVAAKLGVSPDSVVWATAQAKRILPPPGMIVDRITGKVFASLPSPEAALLGIPVNADAVAQANATTRAEFAQTLAANQALFAPGRVPLPAGAVSQPGASAFRTIASQGVQNQGVVYLGTAGADAWVHTLSLLPDGSFAPTPENVHALDQAAAAWKASPENIYTSPAVASALVQRGVSPMSVFTVPKLLASIAIDPVTGHYALTQEASNELNGLLVWLKRNPFATVPLSNASIQKWLNDHAISIARIPLAGPPPPRTPVKSITIPLRSVPPPAPTNPAIPGYNRFSERSKWTAYYLLSAA